MKDRKHILPSFLPPSTPDLLFSFGGGEGERERERREEKEEKGREGREERRREKGNGSERREEREREGCRYSHLYKSLELMPPPPLSIPSPLQA
jgi:hypothetical protein